MITDLLRQVPLFSTLPDADIDLLVSSLREVSYPAGTVLIREGEQGEKFYIVLEGQVAVIKALETANELVVTIRGPGEFIGEMSLLNQVGLRTASVRVHTDARLMEMTRTEFDQLLARVPSIAYIMLQVLSTRLEEAHNITIRNLTAKNLELEQAYTELKAAQEQIIQKEITDRELEQGREIQISILPRSLACLEGCQVGARMVPARMVGGDFYDVIPLDADRLALVVGDVSGKGVPAALYMALTCTLIRAETQDGISPETVLRRVNQHLLNMNTRSMFVTVLFGVLTRSTREFCFVRAAHEIPMIWNEAGETTPVPEGRGQPLGLFPHPLLDSQTITLPPGSTLVMYSDGVTEARNTAGKFFGERGLENAAPPLLNRPAQHLCDALIDQVLDFHGEAPQSDDITILAFKLAN